MNGWCIYSHQPYLRQFEMFFGIFLIMLTLYNKVQCLVEITAALFWMYKCLLWTIEKNTDIHVSDVFWRCRILNDFLSILFFPRQYLVVSCMFIDTIAINYLVWLSFSVQLRWVLALNKPHLTVQQLSEFSRKQQIQSKNVKT